LHQPMTRIQPRIQPHIKQSLRVALLLACLGSAAAAQDYAVDAAGLPILSSNPGAVGALYMDFTGGTFNGTTWDQFNNSHSQQENDPNTFVGSEQQDIYDSWQDVATHFAMFDINVTTVDPDKTVTPTGHQLLVNKNGGGSANTNVFGMPTDGQDQARGVNSIINVRNRTSSISHEFGHILGLNHHNQYDAQGDYVTQYESVDDNGIVSMMGKDHGAEDGVARFASWQLGRSLGHPTNNIKGTLQDDLDFIAQKLTDTYDAFTDGAYSASGGDGYRPDEHGNTLGSATTLTLNNQGPAGTDQINVTAAITGIIERVTDTDMFRLNWNGGDFTVTAEAVRTVQTGADYNEYASSLGMLLSLVDSQLGVIDSDGGTPQDRSGTGLVDINFFNDVDATLTVTDLAAGTYYLAVDSLGEYDDIGAYTLELSGVESTLIPEPSSLLALLATTGLLLRRRR